LPTGDDVILLSYKLTRKVRIFSRLSGICIIFDIS